MTKHRVSTKQSKLNNNKPANELYSNSSSTDQPSKTNSERAANENEIIPSLSLSLTAVLSHSLARSLRHTIEMPEHTERHGRYVCRSLLYTPGPMCIGLLLCVVCTTQSLVCRSVMTRFQIQPPAIAVRLIPSGEFYARNFDDAIETVHNFFCSFAPREPTRIYRLCTVCIRRRRA